MVTNEIIVFYICILTPLFMHFMHLLFGCQHDCYFSDNTIKKPNTYNHIERKKLHENILS